MSIPKRIIILAAGSSERLGQPKQLLPFRGRSLIMHSVMEAIKALDAPPVVVVGGYEEQVRKELADTRTDVIFNPDWPTGMASSIRTGLVHAMKDPGLEAAMIVLCDQPFVTSPLMTEMFSLQLQSGKPIIACIYADGTMGTPVLYHRTIFNELLHLTGHEGARKIVRSRPERVVTVDFPLGAIDVDTMEDYKNLEVN
jgi:molybdenum cofactor cytidylyltransferase